MFLGLVSLMLLKHLSMYSSVYVMNALNGFDAPVVGVIELIRV